MKKKSEDPTDPDTEDDGIAGAFPSFEEFMSLMEDEHELGDDSWLGSDLDGEPAAG